MATRSLDILIRAHDEASQKFGTIRENLGGLRQAVMRFGGTWLAIQGVNIALEGFKVAQAAAAQEAALAAGDLDKIFESQIRYHESTKSLVGSIPILGSVLSNLIEVFDDTVPALSRSKEVLEQWRATAVEVGKATLQALRAAALAAAETPEAKAAVRLGQEAEDRGTLIEKTREGVKKLDAEIATQQANVERLREKWEKQKGIYERAGPEAGRYLGGMVSIFEGGFRQARKQLDLMLRLRADAAGKAAALESAAAKESVAKVFELARGEQDREGRETKGGPAGKFTAALDKLLQEQLELNRALLVASGCYSDIDMQLDAMTDSLGLTADEAVILREELQKVADLRADLAAAGEGALPWVRWPERTEDALGESADAWLEKINKGMGEGAVAGRGGGPLPAYIAQGIFRAPGQDPLVAAAQRAEKQRNETNKQLGQVVNALADRSTLPWLEAGLTN